MAAEKTKEGVNLAAENMKPTMEAVSCAYFCYVCLDFCGGFCYVCLLFGVVSLVSCLCWVDCSFGYVALFVGLL